MVPPHGLRGTHATLTRSAGTAGHVIAAQLGHTSSAMTEAHYIAPGTSRQVNQRAVVAILGNAGGSNRYQEGEKPN